MAKTCYLFISHSWSYGDAYERLIALLGAAPYFSFKNFSVPKDDPVHNAPNSKVDTGFSKSTQPYSIRNFWNF